LRIEGLIPFNRNTLWKNRELMTRSSTGHIAIGPATAAPTPATLLAPANSSHVDRDDDHVPEDPKAPSRHHAFGDVTDRVQVAMNFIVALSPTIRFDEAPLNFDRIVARNLRLEDTCKVFAEFLASSAEQPRSDKSKITVKRMFGLYGSAT